MSKKSWLGFKNKLELFLSFSKIVQVEDECLEKIEFVYLPHSVWTSGGLSIQAIEILLGERKKKQNCFWYKVGLFEPCCFFHFTAQYISNPMI